MKGKSWIYYAIGAVVLIVLLALVLSQCSGKKTAEKNLKKSCDSVTLLEDLNVRNRNLTAENNTLRDDIFGLENQKDSLQGVINGLTRALADCQGKKPIPAPKITAKKAATPKKIETAKQAPTPVQVVTSAPEPKKEDFAAEKTALLNSKEDVPPVEDNTVYKPVFKGDVGETLYDKGYLIFYLSDKMFQAFNPTIEAPLFNTPKGIPFTREGEYWVFRSRIKGKIGGYMPWCAYIGQNQEYNFPMFLPHEWQKTGDKSVQTLINAGSIRPNGRTGGDGVTEGWEFYLPTYAEIEK